VCVEENAEDSLKDSLEDSAELRSGCWTLALESARECVWSVTFCSWAKRGAFQRFQLACCHFWPARWRLLIGA